MLFNSPEFIFLFLPITLTIFFSSGHNRAAKTVVIAASLIFYSWWNPANLPILLSSILLNYGIGVALAQTEGKSRKVGLIIGITANILLLGYFKYANFFVSNLNAWLGTNLGLSDITLPLGISFFTFQQIAYLVDVYQNKIVEQRCLNYISFVTFFPYITAGPLLRYQQIIPQFTSNQTYQFQPQNLAIGVTIFAVGLFKKTVIADAVAPYADQVFNLAGSTSLTVTEAWVGALAFTLQLYFDFSGYSDMAIGIARMFGITLPINFSSPYKAQSMIDFWRRWHITLSNFLRDYLYIPLGGNRKGEGRRYANLFATMLLGGLWHGAGWNFVIWGGLHGLYLSVNHLWRSWRSHSDLADSIWHQKLGWLLTFIAVVVGWVFFRAESSETAVSMLSSMAGFNGISLLGELMPHLEIEIAAVEDVNQLSTDHVLLVILSLLLFVWVMPNTQQWMGHFYSAKLDSAADLPSDPSGEYTLLKPKFWQKLQWQPNRFWATVSAVLTIAALLNLSKVSEFLYREF